MKVIFANGTETDVLLVTGAHRVVQGASRDTLTFVFPENMSLDEVDNLFTSDACEKISLINDDEEFVYNAYTIRVELKRTPVVVAQATEEAPEVIENRIMVSMGQRTYVESQFASLVETVDVLVMESLMSE